MPDFDQFQKMLQGWIKLSHSLVTVIFNQLFKLRTGAVHTLQRLRNIFFQFKTEFHSLELRATAKVAARTAVLVLKSSGSCFSYSILTSKPEKMGILGSQMAPHELEAYRCV